MILSDLPALREAAGGRGIYLRPDDVDGWAATIETLAQDDTALAGLREDIDGFRPMTAPAYFETVRDFLLKSDVFGTFLALTENWILWAWPFIQQEGRAYHNIAIGCTGGQHRSVALVEMLSTRLRRDIPKLVVVHRELHS